MKFLHTESHWVLSHQEPLAIVTPSGSIWPLSLYPYAIGPLERGQERLFSDLPPAAQEALLVPPEEACNCFACCLRQLLRPPIDGLEIYLADPDFYISYQGLVVGVLTPASYRINFHYQLSELSLRNPSEPYQGDPYAFLLQHGGDLLLFGHREEPIRHHNPPPRTSLEQEFFSRG